MLEKKKVLPSTRFTFARSFMDEENAEVGEIEEGEEEEMEVKRGKRVNFRKIHVEKKLQDDGVEVC